MNSLKWVVLTQISLFRGILAFLLHISLLSKVWLNLGHLKELSYMSSPTSPLSAAAPSKSYFAALDGLRGIMAVLVALFHTPWLNVVSTHILNDNAYVILDLFFVFSGFLMFTLYAEKLASGSYSPSRFLVRRIARLYPLHLFVLVCFMGWTVTRTVLHGVGIADGVTPYLFAGGSPESFGNFLAEVFLLNSIGFTNELAFNAPSWTVGAEFLCYIIFALTVPFLGRFMKTRLGVATLTLLVIGSYGYLATHFTSMNITYDGGGLRCFAGFYLGILIAISRQSQLFVITQKSTLIEVATLIVCGSFIAFLDGPQQFLVAPYLFLFVTVFMQDGGAVSKILARKPNLWLARVSYSVYLNHMLIAILVDLTYRTVVSVVFPGWEPTLLVGTLVLLPYMAVVLITSELTYRYIEVPGGKMMTVALSRFIRDTPVQTVDGTTTAK